MYYLVVGLYAMWELPDSFVGLSNYPFRTTKLSSFFKASYRNTCSYVKISGFIGILSKTVRRF